MRPNNFGCQKSIISRKTFSEFISQDLALILIRLQKKNISDLWTYGKSFGDRNNFGKFLDYIWINPAPNIQIKQLLKDKQPKWSK